MSYYNDDDFDAYYDSINHEYYLDNLEYITDHDTGDENMEQLELPVDFAISTVEHQAWVTENLTSAINEYLEFSSYEDLLEIVEALNPNE